MDYDAILDQVVRLLQREQRLSCRALKRRLQLDDETLEDLKEDLIYAKQLALDEAGRAPVWAGGAGAATAPGLGITPSAEPLHAGEFATGLAHLERAYARYDPQHHHAYVTQFGVDVGVFALSYISHALWGLGYPDQAVQRSREALALAQEVRHPFSIALAQDYAAMLQQFRREPSTANKHAEIALTVCIEQGFAHYLA
jgi:hypothetical protein